MILITYLTAIASYVRDIMAMNMFINTTTKMKL